MSHIKEGDWLLVSARYGFELGQAIKVTAKQVKWKPDDTWRSERTTAHEHCIVVADEAAGKRMLEKLQSARAEKNKREMEARVAYQRTVAKIMGKEPTP